MLDIFQIHNYSDLKIRSDAIFISVKVGENYVTASY